MKYYSFVLATSLLLSSGCIAETIADEAAESAGEECQRILEEERPKIVDEIRAECEALMDKAIDAALKDIEEFCTTQAEDIRKWCTSEFDRLIDEAEEEVMSRAGCVADGSDLGWDCSDSSFCPDPTVP